MRVCGACVMRNAHDTDPLGFCTVAGEQRTHDAPPCPTWFGKEQLRAPLYGKPFFKTEIGEGVLF